MAAGNKYVFLTLFLYINLLSMQAQVNIPPSQNPPGNLEAKEVPMFVGFGFDDNVYSGDAPNDGNALSWLLNFIEKKNNPAGTANKATYDGTPCRFTFFCNSKNFTDDVADDALLVMKVYNRAYKQGHEIANHTHSHKHGKELKTSNDWLFEMGKCSELFSNPIPVNTIKDNTNYVYGPGILPEDIKGFRTPYLEYDDSTFKAVSNAHFHYDSSIEEGFQKDQDGTNYYWPYTLDKGSPGYQLQYEKGVKKTNLENYPGLWEFPNYALIVPPDDSCQAYGVEPGLRQDIANRFDGFDPKDGKITGFDYNLWTDYKFSKQEFLATLKYSFNQHYNGNRCPFLVGAHSQYYHPTYQENMTRVTTREAQEAIEEFINYVLSKPDVRIVSISNILKWCEHPVPLSK